MELARERVADSPGRAAIIVAIDQPLGRPPQTRMYRRRRATHPVMSTDWRISVTAAIVSVQSTGDYSLFNARAALRIIKDSVLYIDEVLYKKGPTRPLSLGKPTDPIRGTAVAHNHGIMAESSTSRH